MPIFSPDSMGAGRGSATVVANENYDYSDFGRILSECVQNDMAVFNACLANDFKETAAIQEGTMVASELNAFREFSVREAWGSLKEKLKKLWEKIKGVFKKVTAKLTVWLVRNGKQFATIARKRLANASGLGNCEIPKYYQQTPFYKANVETAASTMYKKHENIMTQYANDKMHMMAGNDGPNPDKSTLKMLTSVVAADSIDAWPEAFDKACFNELTDKKFSELNTNYNSMLDNISGKSEAIKKLKKAEKEADKSIKAAIKKLDNLAKKAENSKDDKEKAAAPSYKAASAWCSGFERAITICTRAQINAIKKSVKTDRQCIGKLMAYTPTKESALWEQVCWLEGADDFDGPDGMDNDNAASDLQDVIDDAEESKEPVVQIIINGDECGANC